MLKIKDNVDLKELEKFGFELPVEEGKKYFKEWKEFDVAYCKYTDIREDEVIVVGENKEIRMYIDTEYYRQFTLNITLELLYDLIQAGLVEKVEEYK